MKISELLQRYDFHDSLIESINFDKNNSRVSILIFLCNWLQKDYTDNQPENIRIQLVFHNVTCFHREESGNHQLSDEIVDIQLLGIVGDRSQLQFLVTAWNDVRSILFETDGVEIIYITELH